MDPSRWRMIYLPVLALGSGLGPGARFLYIEALQVTRVVFFLLFCQGARRAVQNGQSPDQQQRPGHRPSCHSATRGPTSGDNNILKYLVSMVN